MVKYIDNHGVGSTPFLDLLNGVTPEKSFTQEDIYSYKVACCLSANNEVDKGVSGGRLFGVVTWVSTELLPGLKVPVRCAVQARGVACIKYVGRTPVINESVILHGDGRVRKAPSVHGRHFGKNFVISVNEENQTCEVWLG